MNFYDAFKEDRQIPLHEAASFFTGIKKFAEWTDPPDMTGQLEGMFNVPVEQVLDKLKSIIAMKFRKMVGYYTYAQSFRDHAWRAIKIEFYEHAEDEQEDAEFYVKRAVALGGPVHMEDIAAPPPSNNPYSILKMMARAEQEAIAAQRELLKMVGDENPMKTGIDEALHHDQHHLDEMWQIMTQEEHQAVELGGEAGMEPPIEEGVEEEEPVEEELPQAGEDEDMEVMASMRLSAFLHKLGADKTPPTDKELKETGRQRGVTALAAEAAREKGRRGERMGQTIGTIGGAVGGAALGKKYIGGKAGTIAGLAAGAVAGGRAGKELGTEHDIRKNASEEPKKSLLRRWAEHKGIVGDKSSPWKHGAKEKAASMRFSLALMKLAEGEMDSEGMAAPTSQELEPTNYLQAELAGRQAQEQNESAFYREQLGQAQAQSASLQQQVSEAQMQLQQVSQQAQQASEQIQAATQQAVMAQDAATQQSLEAAKARIGAQEMRAKMLELASQDPSTFGEQAFAPAAPPGMDPSMMGQPGMGAPEGGAPAPEAGAPAPAEGPAGQAPAPGAPPGEVPTEAGAAGPGGPTAPVGPPPGANPGQAMPAGQMKISSVLSDRLIGAGVGAGLGAGGSLLAGSKAPEYAARAQEMEAGRTGSFLNAVQIAKAKQKAATSELAAAHPVGSALAGGLTGAVAGASMAPSIRREGGRLYDNLTELAGR